MTSFAQPYWLPAEETLPCTSVKYTQKSCSKAFSCGRSLQETVEGIVKGVIDPLVSDFLVLTAVRFGDRLYSIDNRRLLCMRTAAKLLNKPVFARVRVYDFASGFQEFMRWWWMPPHASGQQYHHSSEPGILSTLERVLAHYDTDDDGETIHVRGW